MASTPLATGWGRDPAAAISHRLDRILDQIDQDLLELNGIDGQENVVSQARSAGRRLRVAEGERPGFGINDWGQRPVASPRHRSAPKLRMMPPALMRISHCVEAAFECGPICRRSSHGGRRRHNAVAARG
jgi:hypothetical protein